MDDFAKALQAKPDQRDVILEPMITEAVKNLRETSSHISSARARQFIQGDSLLVPMLRAADVWLSLTAEERYAALKAARSDF